MLNFPSFPRRLNFRYCVQVSTGEYWEQNLTCHRLYLLSPAPHILWLSSTTPCGSWLDACDLLPTPADKLPILAGIQPAEFHRKEATLFLQYAVPRLPITILAHETPIANFGLQRINLNASLPRKNNLKTTFLKLQWKSERYLISSAFLHVDGWWFAWIHFKLVPSLRLFTNTFKQHTHWCYYYTICYNLERLHKFRTPQEMFPAFASQKFTCGQSLVKVCKQGLGANRDLSSVQMLRHVTFSSTLTLLLS